jgi:WD40 repeat protein
VWPNVSLSPDGRWAATNRWKDKEMRIWDLRSKDCVHTVPVYSGNAAFTPDGKYLVTNGYYEPCRILETTTWREMRQIESEPAGIACRPDGAVLALTTLPSAVALFDVATFAPAASLESSGFAPGQLQFGPDGSHVIVMQAHRVLVWDLAALKDELAKLHTELGLPAWTGACPPPLDAAAPIER